MILLVFIFGLVFGSFANVLIYRIPLEKSIIKPGSSCPACGRGILWYDNIPVLSFLLLKGRCRFCKEKISIIYPLVELFMGISFALSFYFFGFTLKTLVFIILSFYTIVISAIDLKYRIIPDEINLTLFLFGVFIPKEGIPYFKGVLFSVLSGICAGVILLILAVIFSKIFKTEALGMGDVKLITALAAFGGFSSIFWLIFISSLIGSVVGIFIKIVKRQKGYTTIAFGPYLCLALIIFLILKNRLASFLIL